MCDLILVNLLKMRPGYSQSSRKNATPPGGTSPLASYKEVPAPPGCNGVKCVKVYRHLNTRFFKGNRKPEDIT